MLYFGASLPNCTCQFPTSHLPTSEPLLSFLAFVMPSQMRDSPSALTWRLPCYTVSNLKGQGPRNLGVWRLPYWVIHLTDQLLELSQTQQQLINLHRGLGPAYMTSVSWQSFIYETLARVVACLLSCDRGGSQSPVIAFSSILDIMLQW